ncbi:MAG TPA: ABC transporter ATP-binding protein, partial [Bacillota bacterium]|nr:ABC transporter ATP-binding protein [Bacillota bacterium]
MVQYISDRVAVMYLGQIVELAESFELYENPLHPYTRGLMEAIPIADPVEAAKRERVALTGDVAGAIDPGPGCRFAPRCAQATEQCRTQQPEYREVSPGHFAACHQV